MKTLTFELTIQVSELGRINVSDIEEQVGRAILSDEQPDFGDADELGASARLLEIIDE